MRATLIAAAVLAACSAAPVPRRPAAGDADVAAELRQLTRQRFEANARNDRAFYERLLAPNALVMIPHRPAQSRNEYLDYEFRERPAEYRGGTAAITEFRAVVDGDTAVVSYHVVESTSLGEQDFGARMERLDAYARDAGGWRLLCMAMAEEPSWPDVARIDPALCAEYAGTYELSPDLQIVVTNEAGHLMSAMTGQSAVELFPENASTFFDRTDSPLARTVFERDASGRVVAQVYRAQGQSVRARKILTDER